VVATHRPGAGLEAPRIQLDFKIDRCSHTYML
jgi:hypothetical protein